MANFPIIKRVQQQTFELIDIIDYYSHLPVLAPNGKGMVLKIDRKKDIVTVENIKDNSIIKEFKSRQVKVMVRPLMGLRGRHLRILCNLALNQEGFNFSATRTGSRISCVGQDMTVNVNIRPRFNLSVEDNEGISYDTMNVGYITMYLAKHGFDLFNILSTSYARYSKQQGN